MFIPGSLTSSHSYLRMGRHLIFFTALFIYRMAICIKQFFLFHRNPCQLCSCCAAMVLPLHSNSLPLARLAIAFSVFSFLNKYSIFPNLVYSNYYQFPLFSPVILYWLFVPNCLLHFAPNMTVLLDKLALLLNCAIVALDHLMDCFFPQRAPSSHSLLFLFSQFLCNLCSVLGQCFFWSLRRSYASPFCPIPIFKYPFHPFGFPWY